jgi:hypothetical protein
MPLKITGIQHCFEGKTKLHLLSAPKRWCYIRLYFLFALELIDYIKDMDAAFKALMKAREEAELDENMDESGVAGRYPHFKEYFRNVK